MIDLTPFFSPTLPALSMAELNKHTHTHTTTPGQTCSNSLAGYEASGVCCPTSCGQCGGVGCSGLGDGCCTGNVKTSGVKCSESKAAPCVIDTDTVDGDGGKSGFVRWRKGGVFCLVSRCRIAGGGEAGEKRGRLSSLYALRVGASYR